MGAGVGPLVLLKLGAATVAPLFVFTAVDSGLATCLSYVLISHVASLLRLLHPIPPGARIITSAASPVCGKTLSGAVGAATALRAKPHAREEWSTLPASVPLQAPL